VVMFHLTCVGWLLFRADSFQTVVAMAHRMVAGFHTSAFVLPAMAILVFYCLVLMVLEWLLDGERNLGRLLAAPWAVRVVAYGYVVLMLVVFRARTSGEFIYFQF